VRTPFSIPWFLFRDCSETYAEDGVLTSQARSTTHGSVSRATFLLSPRILRPAAWFSPPTS
ncbi:hypothetical protein, partial [Brevibacterium otitidis]|uniref:hypothetical protein n=1 Tax=Brevibacterium otitidis TaxID=53364 RepID=UPI003611EAB0